jgi:hypothetical protein
MFDTAKNGTACRRLGSDDMVASSLDYCCIGKASAISGGAQSARRLLIATHPRRSPSLQAA